ncbi:MAG: YbaB/EbfC family nucleoid-associated protein [Bacteroidia bacterium]|nr:YbaB/EbfC family nucleoid-associated protein [Bacteroidia bacterium]
MLGDMMGMMGKLKEAKEKVKATRERLNTIELRELSEDKTIEVVLTANREIKAIHIDDSLLSDKNKLEEALVSTLNKAIKKAGEVHNAELKAVAKEGLPNIPGMDAFLK